MIDRPVGEQWAAYKASTAARWRRFKRQAAVAVLALGAAAALMCCLNLFT